MAAKKDLGFLKVNLLLRKEDQLKFHVRLFKWILSSGRFIVVIVEIIVIGAFIYRYKLDADLLGLQEEIKQQSAYIQSLSRDEQIIRQTQFQLATIQQAKSSSPNYNELFTKIAQYTPRTIRLTRITLDSTQTVGKTTLTITGTTPSNTELSAFIKALQKDPTFSEISLSNIAFEGETDFTITGTLSPKGTSS